MGYVVHYVAEGLAEGGGALEGGLHTGDVSANLVAGTEELVVSFEDVMKHPWN